MMREELNGNPFSVCFNSMKLKYLEYYADIEELKFIGTGNKANVFISYESVLSNLSSIKDIENKILIEKDYQNILISESINLVAHYKKFFKDRGVPVRVFLYYTNLKSTKFKNHKYNDEFRSYYSNKYLNNPKYQLLGNSMADTIIPQIKTIMEFIPDCHFICSETIDSSLIPLIVAVNSDNTYKNFIVSNQRYDTQYLTFTEFCCHYIRKSRNGTGIFSKATDYLSDLFKAEKKEPPNDVVLLSNPTFFSFLLSALGDKHRSIEYIKGYRPSNIYTLINNGVVRGLLTKETRNFEILKSIIPDLNINEFNINYKCTSLESQYKELSEADKIMILNQITDRFDMNSLMELNRNKFADYPLMLYELTS